MLDMTYASKDEIPEEFVHLFAEKDGRWVFAPPIFTRDRLVEAIRNVLGEQVEAAMTASGLPLPRQHNTAILKAFTYPECAGFIDVYILREFQKRLDVRGEYGFED